MNDLHPTAEILSSDAPKPDPDDNYGSNEAAVEPPPADPDKTQPHDPPADPPDVPPARPGVSLGESQVATEEPRAEGDTEQPWDPPPLEAAEKNGR